MTATQPHVTTDLAEIDLDVVHQWLSTDAFWALGRSRDVIETAADHSLNFGLIDEDGALRGYARVVTDYATFAWLCDVYVDPTARGRGFGVQLARSVVETLTPYDLKRTILTTLDAHGVYAKVGFEPLPRPESWMILDAQAPNRQEASGRQSRTCGSEPPRAK